MVKSLARLPPKIPRRYLFREALRDDECGLVRELLAPASNDVVDRVETYVVREVERAHGMTGSQLHGNVDVLDGSVLPVDHEERLREEGHEEAVHDETWGVAARDGSLVDVSNPSRSRVKYFWVRVRGFNDLHEPVVAG